MPDPDLKDQIRFLREEVADLKEKNETLVRATRRVVEWRDNLAREEKDKVVASLNKVTEICQKLLSAYFGGRSTFYFMIELRNHFNPPRPRAPGSESASLFEENPAT